MTRPQDCVCNETANEKVIGNVTPEGHVPDGVCMTLWEYVEDGGDVGVEVVCAPDGRVGGTAWVYPSFTYAVAEDDAVWGYCVWLDGGV